MAVRFLKTLSAKKAAAMICSTPRVKGEIFCQPGSHYALNSAQCSLESEALWNTMIKLEVTEVLNSMGLSKVCQQTVISCCLRVAVEMMKWLRRLTVDFCNIEPEFCAEVINTHSFTWDGRLDKRRAAEQLVKNEGLPVSKRFSIACMFMLVDDIGPMWEQMTSSDREGFKLAHSRLSLFTWLACHHSVCGSAFEHVDVNNIFWKKTMQLAVDVKSDVAVKFCWDMLEPSARDELLVDLVEKVMRSMDRRMPCGKGFRTCLPGPMADVLCFLYTQMTGDQRRNFFETDIFRNIYDVTFLLQLLLESDCYDAHLDAARLSWQIVREMNFAKLLSNMFYFYSMKCVTSYGHDSRLEYQSLAQKVWSQCPDHVRRAFYEDNEGCLKSNIIQLNRDLTRFILKDATCEETVKLFFSTKEQPGLILLAFELHDRNLADDYLCHSVLTQIQKQKYLKLEIELFPFKWDNLETIDRFYDFMNYCLQFEDEVQKENLLKMYEYQRRDEICMAFILAGRWDDLDSFLQRSFSSPKDIMAFKKALLEKSGCDIHYTLIKMDKRHTLERCFAWFQLSQDEIKNLKKECFINHLPTLKWFQYLLCKEQNTHLHYNGICSIAIQSFVEWHVSDHEQALKLMLATRRYVYHTDEIAMQNLIRLLID